MPTPTRALVTSLATGVLLITNACATAPTTASNPTLSPTATPSAPAQASPSAADATATESLEPAENEAEETPAEEPSEESVPSEQAPEPAEHEAQNTEPAEEPAPAESPAYPVNDGYTVDSAAITTTELTTGTPVEDVNAFGFAAADQPSVVFQSPDNSVACLLQPYGAFCMTDDSVNWVLLSVSMKPGATQPRSLQAQGRAATHEWFATGTPLPEGQSISWMGMTCTSVSPSAIHCHDGVTGFTLSDAEGR